MEKYKFLIKPLFFVFNLMFATWLVIKIEKISPSDLGRYKSLFDRASSPVYKVKPACPHREKSSYLKSLCSDYKKGVIDSAKFNRELESFLGADEFSNK
jgi:hypothetical protein